MDNMGFFCMFLVVIGCTDVPTQDLQDTPSKETDRPAAVDNSNSNTGQNSSEPSSETDNSNTDSPDHNNDTTNTEPASEPSAETSVPSYIGGYNVNPCSTNVSPSGYGVGQTAGDFALVDQYGETLRLSDFCGNTVVLVAAAFW